MVYGSDKTRADALRTFVGGKLKTSGNDLLPLNTAGLPNANDAGIVPDNQLFLAGDIRANENIELTGVQTLFMREHNLIADKIAKANPKLTDEQIYQQARRLVTAEIQAITYNEFLPALLGPSAIPAYKGYNPSVNAGIANEFSTAAYRFGHSIVNDDVEFLDNNGNEIAPAKTLADVFFNPAMINQLGVDPVLKYLATDDAQEVDTKVVSSLRNFLFGPPGAGGMDLASLNIQRGRDHGLADYNSTRKAYGLAPVTTFAQITSDPVLQQKLKTLYGTVNNIDLWVGGLAEDHVSGSSMGPLFQKIIADQFERTRDGDRFWYERIYSGDTLKALEATKLSDVIKRNTSLTNLQDNVFFYDPSAATTTITATIVAKSASPTTKPTNSAGILSRLIALFFGNIPTYDGSGNNVLHPTWGEAGQPLLRMAPAAYTDGVSSPAGANRPSARVVSNTIDDQGTTDISNSRTMSDWVYACGQFVDHDLDLTTQGTDEFDIAVPKGDPYFDPGNTCTQVIPFTRSNYGTTTTQWINKKFDNPKRRIFPSFE